MTTLIALLAASLACAAQAASPVRVPDGGSRLIVPQAGAVSWSRGVVVIGGAVAGPLAVEPDAVASARAARQMAAARGGSASVAAYLEAGPGGQAIVRTVHLLDGVSPMLAHDLERLMDGAQGRRRLAHVERLEVLAGKLYVNGVPTAAASDEVRYAAQALNAEIESRQARGEAPAAVVEVLGSKQRGGGGGFRVSKVYGHRIAQDAERVVRGRIVEYDRSSRRGILGPPQGGGGLPFELTAEQEDAILRPAPGTKVDYRVEASAGGLSARVLRPTPWRYAPKR